MSGKYVNTIKSPWGILKERKKIINSEKDKIDLNDPVMELSQKLHPKQLNLIIKEVRQETPTMRTFKLVANKDFGTRELPIFKSGQYLSIKIVVDDCPITRAYSLCSTPQDAIKSGYYSISIKFKEDGLLTNYIFKNWTVGTKIKTSSPTGFFGYNEIRDTKELVGICGGCGVTPIYSIVKNIVEKDLPLNFTMFYGANSVEEIAFKDELDQYEKQSKGKIKIVYVLAEYDSNWEGETGFITSELINKYIDSKNKTFYLCGPTAMYKFLENEMKNLNIPSRRIRREVMGEDKAFLLNDEMLKINMDKTFNITVKVGKGSIKIAALGSESILVALERAGIVCPSQCRSGECGFCRSKLISGKIAVSSECDGRRKGDMIFGYIHLCSTYPITDLEIEIPIIEQ